MIGSSSPWKESRRALGDGPGIPTTRRWTGRSRLKCGSGAGPGREGRDPRFTSARSAAPAAGPLHRLGEAALRIGRGGAALSRQGRYRTYREPPGQGGQGRRLGPVRRLLQPRKGAERDAGVRSGVDRPRGDDQRQRQADRPKRDQLRGVISTKPSLSRYLRGTPGGLLRLDAAGSRPRKTSTASTSSPPVTPTSRPRTSRSGQAAHRSRTRLPRPQVGHRLLPVFHRKENRIRAHVIMCRLALVLVPIAETPQRRDLAHDPRRAGPAHPRHLHRTRQARSGRPPSSPRPSATCSPSSRSRTRRRSSRPPRQAP